MKVAYVFKTSKEKGVVAGFFPQLYQAPGPNPPDQVMTL